MVAYPGEKVNLHVFEQRYRELLSDCESDGITFGIPTYLNGKIQGIGTEMKLLEVSKRYSTGEADIKTKAIGIFRIKEFHRILPNKLYAGGEVERLAFDMESDYVMNEEILEHLARIYDVLSINKPLPESPTDFVTYDIAHSIGFSIEQEYDFLKVTEEKERQKLVLQQMKKMQPIIDEMENVRTKAQMNGHFRHVIPPKF